MESRRGNPPNRVRKEKKKKKKKNTHNTVLPCLTRELLVCLRLLPDPGETVEIPPTPTRYLRLHHSNKPPATYLGSLDVVRPDDNEGRKKERKK